MDDELRKAVKQFLLAHDAYGSNNAIKNLRIEDLRAALDKPVAAPQDQDAKDAARYRWLREYLASDRDDLDVHLLYVVGQESIDETIDAAMEKKP